MTMTRHDKIKLLDEKLTEVKAAERDFQMKQGQFNEQFSAFLRSEGLPENFQLLDLIKKFSGAGSAIEIVKSL